MIKIPSDLAALIVIKADGNPDLWSDSETHRIRGFAASCECYGLIAHSELVGVVMFEADGNIHVSRLPEDHRRHGSRAEYNALLDLIAYGLKKYGSLKARIKHHNHHMKRIAKRLGFRLQGGNTTHEFHLLIPENYTKVWK